VLADGQRQGSPPWKETAARWLTGLDSSQVRFQSAIHLTFNNPTTDGIGEHWHFLLSLTFGALMRYSALLRYVLVQFYRSSRYNWSI